MVRSRIIATTLLCVTFGVTAGCERQDWGPETLGRTSKGRDQVVLNHGRDAYKTYCIGCHGEAGDGAGPAARFLNPKPRDFRSGIIKFAAVESGELPHDADLARVIRSGLHGTSMPQWRFMPTNTVDALVQYIKTFATEAYARDEPHAVIVPSLDPWIDGDMDEARETGAAVYHALARCNSCHPSYMTRGRIDELSKEKLGYGMTAFREDMYVGRVTESDWGNDIDAPDFITATFRSGGDVDSLYRVIVSGVGGTAMPTWRGALPEEQLWAMVHYIKSLADLKGSEAATALRKTLADQPAFSPPGGAAQEEES